MSDIPTDPQYILGQCKQCSKEIQFVANEIIAGEAQVVGCPHCGLETEVYIPQAISPPVLITRRG
jgi:uncharacterized Zn finger protein